MKNSGYHRKDSRILEGGETSPAKMTISKRIKCFKYLVYSYVVLLTITGAAQIVFGAALLWGHIGYFSIVQNKFWAPSTILLALGPFTFILCWMGCQATSQKKRCLLASFSALLVLAICVQFIICGWALAMRESLPHAAEVPVDDSFVEFLEKRNKVDNLHTWNRMQSQLQCCGVDGPLDYRRLAIPWSCCSRPEHAYDTSCTKTYQRGCLAVLSEQIKSRLLFACFVAVGVALFQSIGVFCAIQLTVLLGRQQNGEEDITSVAKRQQELLPLSIQEKGRRELTPPMTLSPMAPGHRLLKTAPPPPPPMMPK